MRQTIPILLLALSAFGQETKPDFTGTWQIVHNNPSYATVRSEIKQADNTISIKSPLTVGQAMKWSVYPTDGTVKKTKERRHTITRTGRWEGRKLILEETGPGNAPWLSSTSREELTLSDDGKILTLSFHSKGGDTRHDYKVEFERVSE